jgi:hypothetical protein
MAEVPPFSIQLIAHQDLDKQHWNNCVRHSLNPLIYAHSEWLDAMSPGWHGLVVGDYEAVMPVTWRRKMGIEYLCQPAFTQQLGLFVSATDYYAALNDCLAKLTTRYRLIEIFLNYANPLPPGEKHHQNFELFLNLDYPSIAGNYKTDLHKNLKRAEKYKLVYEEGKSAKEFISLFQQHYAERMGARPQDYEAFAQLMKSWIATGKCILRQVSLDGGELLATAVLAKDDKRLYNLASTTLPNGRTLEANHYLFDRLIHEFAGSGLVLDFEGSDQPGIARFYQKFGSISRPYPAFRVNRLPRLISWWKR